MSAPAITVYQAAPTTVPIRGPKRGLNLPTVETPVDGTVEVGTPETDTGQQEPSTWAITTLVLQETPVPIKDSLSLIGTKVFGDTTVSVEVLLGANKKELPVAVILPQLPASIAGGQRSITLLLATG